ncbi:tyrosine-type recombinase/integrase [Salinarimonas sp.]|uniref:tyrosine-type recombinase/integrase n=1 Tax=Salinarimonas sp. TaxID=2766526 RepID=UPI0032D98B98
MQKRRFKSAPRVSKARRYTLVETIDRFFREATVKKGTRRTYRSNAKNWTTTFPRLHLDEVDRSILARFVSIRKDKGVTDTTIRRDIAFLGTVFSMAISWGWIDANPITALSKKFLKESPPRTRFLTRREFDRLYAAASETLKPQIVLAVETGMRKEELLGLTIDAIDLRRREIHLQETKTNSPRRVPLSDVAIATISDLIARPGRPPSRFLFCKPDGTRILCNKKGFRAACDRAAIVDFRFHDLRHTFASWWVQSGGDLYKLSRVLGHRTLQMSARYGHLRTDDLHEEMRKVETRRG